MNVKSIVKIVDISCRDSYTDRRKEMLHPYALEEQALARQAAQLREAARRRQARGARAVGRSPGARRLPPRPAVWLGRRLVRLGAWLQGLDPARAGTEMLPPPPSHDPAVW